MSNKYGFKYGFDVGDRVVYLGKIYTVNSDGVGTNPDGETIYFVDNPHRYTALSKTVEPIPSMTVLSKPDGGPAEYYDLPFKDWVTVNDMVEYLSDKQWGKQSWIFKDIIKACTRFGKKSGTDETYDAKKIIYYGARLLMSLGGKQVVRDYLQQLLDDKQFQGDK